MQKRKANTKQKRKCFDILMGVGAKYYPDPSFFLEECLRLGLQKRVSDFPEYFCPRQNKLWLVHWKTRKIFLAIQDLVFRVLAEPGSEACRQAQRRFGKDNVLCAPPGALPGDSGRGCGSVSKWGARYVRRKQ